MQSITKTYRASFREKGSKFIGFLFPVETTEQFESRLSDIKSDYPDATHHCYGWRMDPNDLGEFAQDDGEPAGTAGLPILNQLKSYDMVNSGCVVVRYYGGTNLGKSGLIRAYGEAAKRCLEQASFSKLIPTRNFMVIYPYSQQSKIDQLKHTFDLKEIDSQYLEKITLKLACRLKQADTFWQEIQNIEHHGIEVKKGEASYVTLASTD